VTLASPPTRKGIRYGQLGNALQPLTLSVSERLLASYDEPMVDYQLSALKLESIHGVPSMSRAQDLPRRNGMMHPGTS